MIDSTYEDKLYQTPTFAGAVRKLQTNELRNTVMLRLRRVARMCSRTVSGTAYRFRHGSTLCSPTEEKILCRSPYFAAVTCRQSAPDYPRERGDSQEGGNRRCLPSCAPARRQRTFPRSAERNSPLDTSEKPPARQGRTRLRQFVSHAQPVLKKTAARIGRTR